MKQRWVLFPCAAAMVAAGSLAGCGEQQAGQSTGPSSPRIDAIPATSVELPDDVELLRDRIDESYHAWYGSREDRQASEVVLAYELNGAFGECVEAAGYDHDWRSTINTAVDWQALLHTRWLREPMQYPFAERLLGGPGKHTDDDDEITDPEEIAVTEQCRKENPPVLRPAELLFPVPVEDLDAKWKEQTQSAVEPIAGDEDGFVACVSSRAEILPDRHLDDESYLDMMGSLIQQMSTLEPSSDQLPEGGEQPSPAWDAYVAAETRYETAAWECAAPVYVEGIRALDEVVDTFEVGNADAIEVLEEHWARMRARASELGWSPSEPYAGR